LEMVDYVLKTEDTKEKKSKKGAKKEEAK
jgi:hypothetical protein